MASLISRWHYRSRQFFGALLGQVSEGEMGEAGKVLGPHLYPMFRQMPGQYRRHALSVYHRVRDAGHDDPHLLQAALLHDAGKHDPTTNRHVTLSHRVAIVLLKSTPPGKRLLTHLATHDNPRGPRGYLLYPFHLSRLHAEKAAERAARLGAAPELVALIARHHSRGSDDRTLAALQAADEES